MPIQEQLEDWNKRLEYQKARKQNELAKAEEHRNNAFDAEQQILLLTGGLTFGQSLEAEPEKKVVTLQGGEEAKKTKP